MNSPPPTSLHNPAGLCCCVPTPPNSPEGIHKSQLRRMVRRVAPIRVSSGAQVRDCSRGHRARIPENPRPLSAKRGQQRDLGGGCSKCRVTKKATQGREGHKGRRFPPQPHGPTIPTSHNGPTPRFPPTSPRPTRIPTNNPRPKGHEATIPTNNPRPKRPRGHDPPHHPTQTRPATFPTVAIPSPSMSSPLPG